MQDERVEVDTVRPDDGADALVNDTTANVRPRPTPRVSREAIWASCHKRTVMLDMRVIVMHYRPPSRGGGEESRSWL